MPVTMALAARINQAMTPVMCPCAEPTHDVLEQATGRRVPGTELGERVALQGGDRTGEQERQPNSGTRHLASRAEQGEDPGADHRANPDERRLPDAERSGGGFDAGHENDGRRGRGGWCLPTTGWLEPAAATR